MRVRFIFYTRDKQYTSDVIENASEYASIIKQLSKQQSLICYKEGCYINSSFVERFEIINEG